MFRMIHQVIFIKRITVYLITNLKVFARILIEILTFSFKIFQTLPYFFLNFYKSLI